MAQGNSGRPRGGQVGDAALVEADADFAPVQEVILSGKQKPRLCTKYMRLLYSSVW